MADKSKDYPPTVHRISNILLKKDLQVIIEGEINGQKSLSRFLQKKEGDIMTAYNELFRILTE